MSKLLGKNAYKAARNQTKEKLKPFRDVLLKIFKERNKIENNYKYRFSLRIGEIAHVNGIPCEYLGMGNFGTDTHPGRPRTVKEE